MQDVDSGRLLLIARQQIERGNAGGAVETLKAALGRDPDLAEAHALLAIVLVDMRRLHAAVHEAGLALALEPELPLAHYGIGVARMGQRRFQEAEAHLLQALQLEPEDAGIHRVLATLHELTGRDGLALLDKALQLDPDDVRTHVAIGQHALGKGDLTEAEARARHVLGVEAEHVDALVLMGQVLLRRGDVQDARSHALAALGINPNDTGAIHLLAAVKMRANPFLGLWWRYNAWIMERGQLRAVTILLGMYVVYRLLDTVALQLGKPAVATAINIAWLALVIYTWIGPGMFQKALRKELQQVTLRREF